MSSLKKELIFYSNFGVAPKRSSTYSSIFTCLIEDITGTIKISKLVNLQARLFSNNTTESGRVYYYEKV